MENLKNYLLECGVKDDHIIILALDDEENVDFLNPKILRQYINDKIKDDKLYYIIYY